MNNSKDASNARHLYAKRICIITSIAIVLALMAALFCACTKTPEGIRISEVMSSNSNTLRDDVLGTPDWLELYNPSRNGADISGYMLSDETSNLSKYVFPQGTVIPAKGYLVVYCSADGAQGSGSIRPTAGFNLPDGGVSIILSDASGEMVESISVPRLASDISYAMNKDGSYGFTSSPTPGSENTYAGIFATLDEAISNVVISESICISEVFRGDECWAEIYNPTDKNVELHDFYLTDNKAKTNKWRFPNYSLAPGGYAVVHLLGSEYSGSKTGEEQDGYMVFNADFKLSSQENGIYLYNSYGKLRSEIEYDINMPDYVSAVLTNLGIRYTAEITMGRANSENIFESVAWQQMDGTDSVRISEVLRKNKFGITDADGDRYEWVELHNSSDAPVSLRGYYLSDNSSKPDKWAFPNITLGADEYIIIFLSGKDRTEGELHASFGLSSADDGIFLSNYNGMRVDGFFIPADLHSDVSIGRSDDGGVLYFAQPTPGQANTTVGFTDYMGVGGFNPSSVYISETCAVQQPRSGRMDWVEFYNGSDEEINLAGWHISDDDMELYKYELSLITVPAGGYAILNCSDSILDAGPSVAPFSLSPGGETLILTNPDGIVVDVFETGANRLGVTSGRIEGNSDRVYFTTSTMGAKNPDTCYLSYASAPSFSETAMYHDSAFALELTCRNADGVIRYTLDGSKPTENSEIYTEPIMISQNTVIRAVTFVPGVMESDVSTYTYIFDERHSLPVVCIAMNESDFAEVYAVSKPFVPVVERECFMQYFDESGRLGVESAAGMRVSGASTRAYRQKSLGLYFRGGYGRNEITYPFFGSDYVKTFGSLVLRNAGQDSLNARIRDSFTSTAVLDMNIDASAAQFVVVYVNGEYRGLYDLKENMNEDYLVSHYGVDGDTANIIKRNTMELEGSNVDFLRVREFAAHFDEFGGDSYVIPMTNDRYEQFKQWVDVESIMDYLIARSYFPDSDMFNQKYWRTTDYAVKWRAVFFDSDFALKSAKGNVLFHYFNVLGVPSANGSLSQMDLFCGLNSNEQWRHDFIVRYIYVMKYYLNNDRLLPLFDSMVAQMETEIDRQVARWGMPESRSHWEQEIAAMRQMLIERPAIAVQQLRSYYGITDAQYATFEAEADAIYSANGGNFK
ncbi:MAG: lamin tail domain-containing protein [Christensenellaceae bacterium]|nr:lamin tail domain-containing protein [Christensenellaceae bacterium]